MKKNIFLDKHAERELREFSEEVQLEFEAYLKILGLEGKLDFPHAKKITRDLFEIRIKVQGGIPLSLCLHRKIRYYYFIFF